MSFAISLEEKLKYFVNLVKATNFSKFLRTCHYFVIREPYTIILVLIKEKLFLLPEMRLQTQVSTHLSIFPTSRVEKSLDFN